MTGESCPDCGEPLNDYKKYLYCFRCSKQYKRKLFGKGLKEMENTIQKDQMKAMDR
jgi:hypothetical protein